MGLFDHIPTAPPPDPEEQRRAAHRVALQGIEASEERLWSPPGTPRPEILTPPGVILQRLAKKPPVFDEERRTVFLDNLCNVPNISLAALRAGVLVGQVKALRDLDSAFDQAVNMALGVPGGLAEEETFRRAVQGIQKPHFHQGMDTGLRTTEYSDQLMVKVLEANVDRYEKKTKVTGEINLKHSWLDLVKEANNSEEIPEIIPE